MSNRIYLKYHKEELDTVAQLMSKESGVTVAAEMVNCEAVTDKFIIYSALIEKENSVQHIIMSVSTDDCNPSAEISVSVVSA